MKAVIFKKDPRKEFVYTCISPENEAGEYVLLSEALAVIASRDEALRKIDEKVSRLLERLEAETKKA